MDTDTGELRERRLQHPEEAEPFYRYLAAQGMKVRVGMEASAHTHYADLGKPLANKRNSKAWHTLIKELDALKSTPVVEMSHPTCR